MSEVQPKPAPPPSDLSKAYWDAAKEGKLLLQGCSDCGKLRHYPRLLCDQCYSDKVTWTEATGRGVVHSWTVAHHAFHPAFVSELPYTLVTVDLEEGPRALGRWDGNTPYIGQEVEGRFADRGGALGLTFVPHSS